MKGSHRNCFERRPTRENYRLWVTLIIQRSPRGDHLCHKTRLTKTNIDR